MSGGIGEVVDARIVLWGIAGAGKTTNLTHIHGKLRPDHRGDLRHMPTPVDPGTTYEVLPIELGEISGVRTRIRILAVPDGPEQAPTRKQLLDQVDGVVVVLDSRREHHDADLDALEELRSSLASYGRDLETVPLVLQYNHQDEADAGAVEALHRRIGMRTAAFEAIATRGVGVLQCLTTISKRVVRNRREAAGLTLPPGATPPPIAADAIPDAQAAETVPDLDATLPETDTEQKPDPFGLGPTVPSLEALSGDTTIPEDQTFPETPAAPASDSVAQAIDTAARRAERLFDAGWDQATGGLDARTSPPGALALEIVSAGTPAIEGPQRVRIPLRVVDEDGREAELQVTLDLGKPQEG